jgi:hypothetical protein
MLIDNPQLIKNRCDQRRWLASKYNPLYSDKVAVTDSDGGSIAARLAKMSAAERAAWAAEVAAQARALLEAPTIDHEGPWVSDRGWSHWISWPARRGGSRR